MIKGVIFDMDGTLIDSEYACRKVFKEIIIENNLKYDENIYPTLIGITHKKSNEILASIYGDDKEELWVEWNKRFTKLYYQGKIKAKKGAKELIDYLLEHDVPICLATSGSLEKVKRSFTTTEFKEVPFTNIVTGPEFSNSKPSPDIFLKAIEKLGLKSEECAIVEDSNAGCLASINAHALTILVDDIQIIDAEIMKKIPYHCADLTQVKDLLTKLLNL